MSIQTNRPLRAIPGGLNHRVVQPRRTHPDDVEEILERLDVAISNVAPNSLPALAVAIASRLATVASLLLSGVRAEDVEASASGSDRYVTPEEAARIAGVTRRWIYRHTRGQRFRKDLSRKQVRLNEAGFRSWLANRSHLPGS